MDPDVAGIDHGARHERVGEVCTGGTSYHDPTVVVHLVADGGGIV